jgi:hypothetical protein
MGETWLYLQSHGCDYEPVKLKATVAWVRHIQVNQVEKADHENPKLTSAGLFFYPILPSTDSRRADPVARQLWKQIPSPHPYETPSHRLRERGAGVAPRAEEIERAPAFRLGDSKFNAAHTQEMASPAPSLARAGFPRCQRDPLASGSPAPNTQS